MAFALIAALGLAALSRRGRPTVWPSRMLRWILGGGALAALTLHRQDGALVALALVAAALYVSLRPPSALVLYGPPDGAPPIAAALDRFGVRYQRTAWSGAGRGDRFAVERPAATVTARALPSGPLRARWITVAPAVWTPKVRLLEGVLHKLLSN